MIKDLLLSKQTSSLMLSLSILIMDNHSVKSLYILHKVELYFLNIKN